MTLHNRLREAREASCLSQGQVAQKMQMHRPTISEIEAGRRKVEAAELEKLSQIYGVSVEWLLNGNIEGEPSNAKIQIAARELSRMNEADIDRLLKMLKMLKK